MSPPPRPALHELADRVGILAEYTDQSGTERRVTSDETRLDLLAALGFDAATEEGARRALDELRRRERERLLPPVRVVVHGAPGARDLSATIPEGWSGEVGWEVVVGKESDGEVGGWARADSSGTLRLALPAVLPIGYHAVRLRLRQGERRAEGEQRLIVVPAHCPTPERLLGGRRVFGITANLYTVRSARNWGAGDFTDLARLAEWSAEIGADFVGLNPLHALHNRGADISPYSPVSRLFRNPLYLDIEAIPELAESPELRALIASPELQAELREARAADRVEYERVAALQRRVLEPLHRTFVRRHRDAPTARGRAYREYVASQGESLEDFATFLAIEEWMEQKAGMRGASSGALINQGSTEGSPAPSLSWRHWPSELRSPSAPGIARFRREHAEEMDFHRWVQFELDRQLGEAARAASRAGLAVGLYQDLAIASSPSGSDAWAFQRLLVDGVSIGAPPDEYSEAGQNWGLPPLHPLALAEDGYRYATTLFRSAFRHAGAVRIDHILGFFRQFWIPAGKDGKDGAYVRFPTEELLGILALEATRAGALVVGEDLGTVPPEVPPTLRRWGILGSRVLYFEREGLAFRPADGYEPLSLTTANTHDMATITGWWEGRDVALRREAGIIGDEDAAAARADREEERRLLLERLAADGALPRESVPDADAIADEAALRGAVHDFLCRTPAALVALSLDDLVGETEPVNLPGVGPDRYPSWTRRLRLPLERLKGDAGVARSLGRCRALRPPAGEAV
ncbi:MAG TPA: 4-alpha-glucanotransferase [Gemmatimonadaceae bacterium]|nr:4-alpha-glucanotransferase [Gemmatimonadaceae bacterium]